MSYLAQEQCKATEPYLPSSSVLAQRHPEAERPDAPEAAAPVPPRDLSALLAELRRLDVKLWLDGERLRVNAPAGTLTPELKSELGRRKAELVGLLTVATRAMGGGGPPPIARVRRDRPIPLSSAQQRLWFLDQLQPGNVAYNISSVFSLRGPLRVSVLQRSLEEILRRHESLRTRFEVVAGEAAQMVDPPGPFELRVVDLCHLPASERSEHLRQLVLEEACYPFDLRRAPMMRAVLFRQDEAEHVLATTVHHIAADGWSLGILGRELATIYDAYLHDRPSPLPELPIQYADFTVWQRAWLQGERLQVQLAYWKQKLSGPLPTLDLPTDFPRPVTRSGRGARHFFLIDTELLDAAKALSRSAGATLYMTLLAAFKTLLYRWTRQEDLLVGAPVAGRGHVDTEPLVGFFINNLVLRTDLSGEPTFRELLARVRAVTLEAYANQDVPFEKLVETLQPDRDPSRPPLFQVLFSLQNMDLEDVQLADLTVQPIIFECTTSRFDLSFELYERPEGMCIAVEYNTDLFAETTIRRLADHYATLLAAIVATPDARISELPLLTAAERQQVLVDWNQTQAPYPRAAGVQQLFEAQAARVPDAVAVEFAGQQITYRALNHRANQLARHLQSLGVGPETIVGVYLERSLDMVVALLGILKAGGAYLPLDPLFPPDRLAYMLEDSRASVLLTQAKLDGTLRPREATVVCLDAEWPRIAEHRAENLRGTGVPDRLAYVLYTSGSTGRPKGVQIPHGALTNFLCSMRETPGLASADVLVAVTTLSFDIAGLELFLPLITGARVVLVSSAVAVDGVALRAVLETSGATIMQATPATWRLLLAAGWEGAPTFRVLCGGETLPSELAAQLLARCGSLWNMYGPTETTIWSTIARITAADGPIAIGRPIANTQTYVLDARLQPVPIGVPGELYIGGDGLARGYLNQPELTAQKFIPNPFAAPAGTAAGGGQSARLYRTGDLVRYRADGTLEYLQRVDHQVKIRGFRIELGEIESVLEQHPAVRQAVVVAREDSPGDKRLVAYVTPAREDVLPTAELREHLKEKLPSYMVPAVLVPLAALPLTPNGKVDRQALPAPEATRGERATPFVAPRSEVERQIAAIWQAVLCVETVGLDDNFFDLGGHSLLILQVHSQLCRAFTTDLTIAQMFQYPTVRALADYIQRPQQRAAGLGEAQDRGKRLRAAWNHRRLLVEEG
ncbi:MAG TPA: amino acid adenylation domain-containing protein [Chloroflexota bacterium]|nr:amino acid adenylation domain-containing protein [Chloroflexota bacterium]